MKVKAPLDSRRRQQGPRQEHEVDIRGGAIILYVFVIRIASRLRVPLKHCSVIGKPSSGHLRVCRLSDAKDNSVDLVAAALHRPTAKRIAAQASPVAGLSQNRQKMRAVSGSCHGGRRTAAGRRRSGAVAGMHGQGTSRNARHNSVHADQGGRLCSGRTLSGAVALRSSRSGV